jgi:membrane protein DedA with SNARE-associated domain
VTYRPEALLVPDSAIFWYSLAAFGALILGGMGLPPIPEEGVVVAAGAWVASTPEYWPYNWIILPVCIAGILVSDMMLFGIGRYWGTRLLEHRWLARFLTPDKRRQIQHNFQHYGIKILLLVRWIPGIRSPLFLTAGTMRLPFVRFVVADAIAAACGHALLFFLSYLFTDSVKALYELFENDMKRLKPLLVIVPILAFGLYLLIHFLRKPVPTADPEELPIIGHQVAAKMETPVCEPDKKATTSADGVTAPKPGQ